MIVMLVYAIPEYVLSNCKTYNSMTSYLERFILRKKALINLKKEKDL